MVFVQVFKAMFTSPSSAKDIADDDDDDNENTRPARKQKKTSSGKKPIRRNVASKVHLNNKVTPRSIAYAAVQVSLFYCMSDSILINSQQLHFNLQTAASWAPVYGGFDYRGLYNYVIDFFEDAPGPPAKKRSKDLLNWWSK